jgi:hypothetical protein
MYLTKEQILEQSGLPEEDVSVPEWGGVVRVRGLSGDELDEYQASNITRANGKAQPLIRGMRARLVVRCVVDERGQRLFTEKDVGELGRISGAALDRVFNAAQRLSALNDSEELVKNSESAPTDDFSSGSLSS